MKRSRTRAMAAAVSILLGLLPALAHAQAVGTISGVVSDASGAAVPGASVEAKNRGTGLVRTASSGHDGFYSIPLLPPGLYDVKGSLQGFSTLVRQGIRVNVAETARVNLAMTVGNLSEDLTVVGDAPLVETGNATLGIVIEEKKILDLPLNGRNFTQLGTLIPGVVAPPTGLGGATGDATPGGFGNVTGGFNVNGMRNQSNNFVLDGATNNDTFNTGFVLRPPPDAIQEFKILTHSYTAEFGRNAGSIVNVVTKSGTNAWHGAAWEFNRDDSLQARNYFAPPTQPKPKLKQNQFGATLGGPLARNKLFAFAYYEGFRNQAGTTTSFIVPTAAQRGGNFAGTVIRDPLTGQPFPGGIIPASRLDPIAQRLLTEFVPLPNVAPNRYTTSPVNEDNRDQFGVRLDYQFSNKHTVLGRYLWSNTNRTTPRTVSAVDQTAGATLQDVMLSDTYVFSPRAINVARVSFNRIYANPTVTSGLENSAFGINMPSTNPLAVGLANIAVAGIFGTASPNTLGDPQQPFVERVNNVFQFTDDFTLLRGRHSWKFGIDFRREKMKIAFINRPNGDLTFSGGLTGNAISDFLLGLPAQARRTTTQAIQEGYGSLYAVYAQDQFRLNSRLTLDLGVRYELPIPFVDDNDAITGININVQSQVFPSAPRGLVYPGDPGVPRGVVPTDKNNIAPRVALIWDPTGKGRTSVRGAWGIFYDSIAGQGDFFQSGVLSPPFTPLVELNTPTPITLADPFRAVAGGPTLFPANLTIIGWGTDYETPYAYHYNLTAQHQLWNNVGVEIGYVGSHGKHLPIFMEINPGVYQPGQTTRGARTYPAYALLRPTFSSAESWYNALQASVRMRPSRGLNFLAAYTWSHNIDHVSGLNIGGELRPILPVVQGDQASVDAALAREKGDALFDVRQRFVLSFGYELPKLEGQSGFVRHVLGGWQVNGIFQVQTGFPLTVTEGANLDIRYLSARPDVLCDPNDGPKTTAEYFETSCFLRRTLAQTGERPGNEGRDIVRGPGFSRTDLSLFKNFEFGGRHQIQFRVEAFNLFNQTRLGQPGSTIGTATFGVITTTADDNRIIQLGIKYSF